MQVNRTTKYDDLPQFLIPAEAPGLLGVGRATIYEILRGGDLPVRRFGRRIWIPRKARLGNSGES